MIASFSVLRLGALIVIVLLTLGIGLEYMAKRAGGWRKHNERTTVDLIYLPATDLLSLPLQWLRLY